MNEKVIDLVYRIHFFVNVISIFNADMKILALSIYADDEFSTNMIHAGAVGYILKGCEPQELFYTIRRTIDSRIM